MKIVRFKSMEEARQKLSAIPAILIPNAYHGEMIDNNGNDFYLRLIELSASEFKEIENDGILGC